MRNRVVLALVALAMLSTAGFSQASVSGTVADKSPILGIWRCQMDGLPAVTLTVTDEGGSLRGAVLFYLHRRDPGQTVTATPGVPEPLFNPKFDGQTLAFEVSHRRAHPPGSLHDGPVSFKLRLDGADKAELVNESERDPNAPVFVFVRSEY
jgi:hypothetical protein